MRRIVAAGLVLVLMSTHTGRVALAQGVTASPAESMGPPPAATEDGSETAAELALSERTWSVIRPPRSPAAREDHTWTVDGEGRFAYLFGGRDGAQTFADLWRFDLETDTWKKLSPPGQGPGARSGHSAVWLEGHGLIIFAGQRGTDFFGDLWSYDPAQGSWTKLPAGGSPPKARYGSCMIVGPDRRLWISHGFTFAGRFDDTRAYNLRTGRWTSIAPDGRRPGARCLHECFTTTDGQLVLFGGQDADDPALGDLWKMRDDGGWRQVVEPRPQARRLYALAETSGQAWIFGGSGQDDSRLDDLWRVDRETLRSERVRLAGLSPPARDAATLIADLVRGRLLLFGGQDGKARSDLWQLIGGPTPAVGVEATGEPVGSAPEPSPEG